MEESERLVRAALKGFAATMSQTDINILSTCWLSGGNAASIKDALQIRLHARNKLSLEDEALLVDPDAYLTAEQFRRIMSALSGHRLRNGLRSDRDASPNQGVEEERWLSSREATLRVAKATGHSPMSALYAIIAYAKIGSVRGRALAIKEKANSRYGGTPKVWSNVEIPIWFWENCTDNDSCALDWQSGVFAGTGHYKGNSLTVDLTGVEFNSAGIDIIDPPRFAVEKDETGVERGYGQRLGGYEVPPAISADDTVSGSGPVRREHNKGGRPPAEWWDDLWIEIFRQIWLGDLKPKVQADIEDAMMTWAVSKDHNPATSTIRARARKLWAVYQEVEI